MDDSFDYCREIESYLCKKNEGHLIRIVGPAFEMVREVEPEQISFVSCDDEEDIHGRAALPSRRKGRQTPGTSATMNIIAKCLGPWCPASFPWLNARVVAAHS